MLRATAITFFCVFLSGCAALPIPLRIASWAADGISYVATNKSVFDHGLSAVNGKDCAMIRLATEGGACRDVKPDKAEIANLPDLEVASRAVETVEPVIKAAPFAEYKTPALQAKNGFPATTLVCDVPQLSDGMPTQPELTHCAQLLIDRHGTLGALDQTDLRIAHYVRRRDSGGINIWFSIKMAVRNLMEAAPQTAQTLKTAHNL